MAKKSVLIIGAGLSGLSAGNYSQLAGYKTTIFEHHYRSGGLAASWKRGPYLFEGGIHFMLGYRSGRMIYDTLKDIGAADPNLFVPMKDFCTLIDETDGSRIDIYGDLNRLSSELKAKAPSDSKLIDEIIAGMRAYQTVDTMGEVMRKPLEMDGLVSKAFFAYSQRKALKYMMGDYAKPLTTFVEKFKSPWLKRLFTTIFVPEVPMWFVFLLLGHVSSNHMAVIKNGSASLIDAMEKNYKSLGGEAIYKATVDKILIKDGKAYGIKLKNGEEYKGDYIISTGDGENTYFNLLGGKYVTPEIEKKYKTTKTCNPFFFANFGINKEVKSTCALVNVYLKNPIKCGSEPNPRLNFRVLNYGNFAPPGKTVIQADICSDFDYWNNLRNINRAEYMNEKERVAQEMLKAIDTHYPGVAQAVEMKDTATPCTTKKFTMNKNGSWGGWEFSHEGLSTKNKQTIPGLKNFYTAGQWSASGGVIICINSGRNAIELIKNGY